MRSLKLGLTQLSWMTGNPINLPKCLTDHRKAKNYLFVISNYWMTFLWYSRIIKAEVGVINRSRRQRFIALTRDLDYSGYQKTESNYCFIIHWTDSFSFSLRHKMFSKFVPTLSFPQVVSVLVFHYFFDVLLGQRSKPGSHVFAPSLTASNTKRAIST